MNTDIEFVQKFNLAYNAMCKPLCQQLKLPQTAFDILMFFGNNPEYHTASDPPDQGESGVRQCGQAGVRGVPGTQRGSG